MTDLIELRRKRRIVLSIRILKKIKVILNERSANGIYCNHKEGEKKVQIMKRPELGLNDASEELYKTFLLGLIFL